MAHDVLGCPTACRS